MKASIFLITIKLLLLIIFVDLYSAYVCFSKVHTLNTPYIYINVMYVCMYVY